MSEGPSFALAGIGSALGHSGSFGRGSSHVSSLALAGRGADLGDGSFWCGMSHGSSFALAGPGTGLEEV